MNVVAKVRWKQQGLPSTVVVLDVCDLSAMPPQYLEEILQEHFVEKPVVLEVLDAEEVIGKGGVLHGVAVIRSHEFD